MAKKNFDAVGNEINITSKDFELVQLDAKIHDKKFETKATTFIQDAFRRFCKNKSSVVGAIIIGILLLLSFLVPTFSPYDIDGAHPYEIEMLPKIFDAGTGFWDGTERITRVAYDKETNAIYGYEKMNADSITNLYVYEEDGTTYCDFTYDKYQDVFGVTNTRIMSVNLKMYVKNGWCTWDEATGTFERLTDDCPILRITKIDGKKIYGDVARYVELGYKEAPKFIFGTDNQGRDILTLAFASLSSSLLFSLGISSICFLFGLVWGAISGYFGGNIDLFMERFMEILGGVPTIVIVTLFRLHLGDHLWVFALSLCFSGWMGTASRTRTQFYRFKGREYVLASRTLGASDSRLIFKHILPNSLGTLVTSSVLMIPSLIFTESTFTYLGLGLQGNRSFGKILAEQQSQIQHRPMLIIVPAIIISLLMISFNLFGNGLRDALNPSLKGSE